MPVYGTQKQGIGEATEPAVGPPLCPETTNVVVPDQPCDEGCPILVKQRTVLLEKGVSAVVEWPLRMRDGRTTNLENCDEPSSVSISMSASVWEAIAEGTIVVRFSDCDFKGPIYEIEGTIQDVANGTVRFTPPDEVIQQAGIYQMSIGIRDEYDRIVFHEPGLLSVERSLFGDSTQITGPPTIRDLRLHLRDTAIENDLLDDVEFDTSEIVSSIVRPIQHWNEVPPPVAPFTCKTFPFRYHWLQATVGELLLIAVHSYMRNNLKVNHGGVKGNFKDKYREYAAVAEKYKRDWQTFVVQKKMEINAELGFGSSDSLYYRASSF